MNDEKKPYGGVTPELNDAALDAVSGGSALNPHKKPWDQMAWDWVGELYGVNNDTDQKEQQP